MDMDIFHWVVISGWVIALCMIPVLARRYSGVRAWGWIAIIFALPGLGLLLYLLLGENPLGKRRIARYRRIIDEVKDDDCLSVLDPHRDHLKIEKHWSGIGKLAEACGSMPPVTGNTGELSADNDKTLEWLIRDIDAAEHHVHMVFYIFNDDRYGHALAEALVRAAKRGVTCRVMADAVGSHRMFKKLGKWMQQQGVQLHPLLKVNPLRTRLARIDLRNHRKIVVIDGKIGYIGSWNVITPDIRGKRIGNYEDLMFRIQGPATLQLQTLFLEDWTFGQNETLENQKLFPPPEIHGEMVIQTMPSGPLYPFAPVRDLAVAAINQAAERVVLNTPYFAPDEPLMLALRMAVQRGVQVDLICPHITDARIADAGARSFFRELLEIGANIHLYQRGLLHTKLMTADADFAMLGSANFDNRSFRLDIEANVLIYSHDMAAKLRALQEDYMSRSKQLDLATLNSRPWISRVADDCARLLSPLM